MYIHIHLHWIILYALLEVIENSLENFPFWKYCWRCFPFFTSLVSLVLEQVLPLWSQLPLIYMPNCLVSGKQFHCGHSSLMAGSLCSVFFSGKKGWDIDIPFRAEHSAVLLSAPWQVVGLCYHDSKKSLLWRNLEDALTYSNKSLGVSLM